MTSTRIIISSSIIFFALALNFFLGDPVSESLLENTARNDPDLYMLNAKIQRYSEYGVLDYELSANKFTHFPLTNLTTLETPSLTLLSKGSTPWKINAEHGRLMPASPFREEVVELWNNVSAVKQESNGQVIHITTDSLAVFPDKNYAETNERVREDNCFLSYVRGYPPSFATLGGSSRHWRVAPPPLLGHPAPDLPVRMGEETKIGSEGKMDQKLVQLLLREVGA